MSFVSRTIAALAAATAAMAVGGFALAADAPLRMSSQWTENTIGSGVDKWWAKEVENRTGGKVKIKIFFEGALGKAGENLTLIRQGAIDLAAMSASYFPADLPLHTAPIIISDIFAALRKINREQGTTLLIVEQNAHIALKNANFGYVLQVGRVVVQGSAGDLQRRKEVVDSYMGVVA